MASKPTHPAEESAPSSGWLKCRVSLDNMLKQARRLHEKLHGKGKIGDAFQQLCKLGVDAEWLERQLVRLQRTPARSHGTHRKQEELDLNTAISKLRTGLRNLEASIHLLPVLVDPADITVLRETIDRIEHTARHTSPLWSGSRVWAQPDHIAAIVAEVRLRTSDHKPHFELLAALIQAATGKDTYSVENLKMIESHAKSRSRKTRRTA